VLGREHDGRGTAVRELVRVMSSALIGAKQREMRREGLPLRQLHAALPARRRRDARPP